MNPERTLVARHRLLLVLLALSVTAVMAGAAAAGGTLLSQTKAKTLRTDCNGGSASACAELLARVDNATNKGNERGLLCLFYRPVSAEMGMALDLAHLTALLGQDAPPGVADALVVLAGGPGVINSDEAQARSTLDGYVGPICLVGSERKKTVIRSDNAIGSFRTKVPKGGTLGHARTAFGPPDTIKRSDPLCTARWKARGLKMFFANLGGANACADDTGFFTLAVTSGPKWRTANGLAIGHRLRTLLQKFPNAQRGERRGGRVEWWLVTARVPPAFGAGATRGSPHSSRRDESLRSS